MSRTAELLKPTRGIAFHHAQAGGTIHPDTAAWHNKGHLTTRMLIQQLPGVHGDERRRLIVKLATETGELAQGAQMVVGNRDEHVQEVVDGVTNILTKKQEITGVTIIENQAEVDRAVNLLKEYVKKNWF